MMPRLHPETNENLHKRFAQHRGSPRRGAMFFSFVQPFFFIVQLWLYEKKIFFNTKNRTLVQLTFKYIYGKKKYYR
jgi:hypothetical protein